DSLVLVNHVNAVKRNAAGGNGHALIAQATTDRLRAIVMTTVTTVAGLLPLAYGWGGADPFIAPMAMSLGYGVFLATPLTLILIPCLYAIGEDIRTRFQQRT
ncbi:MAG: efflux RND transporter permease subunit, partial [Candidatus Omnitrophica bacterium]|nr:efflux RND transporter permease subunit [Candidatus Omnitrophota bacterium]